MLRGGHKGASGYEPENTLRSFQKALNLNTDIIELDVHKCKTGELIVIHDNILGKKFVKDLTLEEIKSQDAGKGERIPLLTEVLNLIKHRAIVNIELKDESSAKIVAQIIQFYIKNKKWSYDNFLVSSFNLDELKKIKKIDSNINIAILWNIIPDEFIKIAKELKVFSLNLNKYFINKDIVDKAHSKNIRVLVWTVNEPTEIEKMKKLGVDGIFSDYPDRI